MLGMPGGRQAAGAVRLSEIIGCMVRFSGARGFIEAAAILAVLAAALPAQEEEQAAHVRNYLEDEHSLTPAFETPHTRWAKPYAGGPVRVLFFSPWYQGSTEAREIIELMERFDLQAEAVYQQKGGALIGDGRADWYGGDPEAGTKRALRLLERPNAVLFINELKLGELPGSVREKIRQKVMQGTGLVLVGSGSEAPAWSGARGRVALMASRQRLRYEPGWETTFDYQMQEQGRKLLWAARREPREDLRAEVAPEIDRLALASHPARLSWPAMPAGTKIRAVLRRWDGEKISLKTLEAGGAGRASVPLPVLREGAYHLDVFASTGGVMRNWATAAFTVRARQHAAEVMPDRDWAETGGRIGGRVRLAGAMQKTNRLRMRLVDVRGRILAQQDTAARDAAPFQFEVAPWMPMLMRLEAVLMDGGAEVSSAWRFVRAVRRHRGQFHFMMWNGPSGDLAPYGYESLARNGVTLMLQAGAPPAEMAANELSYVPYAASFRASSHTTTAMLDPETGWLKSGCVYDREKMRAAIAQAVEGARAAREHGVFAYSLGDENAVRGSCLSPYCLHAYRRYLKDTYRRIEDLNAEWNTRYRDFDEIGLLRDGPLPSAGAPGWFREYFADRQNLHFTDSEGAKGDLLARQVALGNINDEIRALEQGNFPRWYDRQAFQNQTYIEWAREYQRAFRELDPEAWTGFEGTDSFSIRRFTTRTRQGGDLDMFVRQMDYFGPYNDPANEVVRSIARPGFPRGNWMGYDPEPEKLLRQFWGQVTDGMNMVQWWRWDNLSGYHGFLSPNLSPFPAVRELVEDTQVVRDGLGELLMRLRMEDDQIAMLYSMPSTYISHFDGNETYGNYKRDHDVWRRMLHGCGLQFRYVTDRMLRRGEFDAGRYKVLILPLAYAIGPREASVIREFARNGGTVIADLRPGMYDGHLKPLEQGALDDLFGIRRRGKRNAVAMDRMSADGEWRGTRAHIEWGNWHGHDVYPQAKVDPSVEVTAGKPLGQAFQIHYWTGLNAPVAVVNEFGKGRAILLNWSVFEVPTRDFLNKLLGGAGVTAAIGLAREDGGPTGGIEVTRWANGRSAVVALLGGYSGRVRVKLAAPSRVYNLRERKYYGETATFTATLRADRATFLALEAAEEAAPEIRFDAARARPGETVRATVRIGGAAGLHPVTLRVFAPGGEHAAWFDGTVLAGGTAAGWTLPLAFNDPAGEWTIRAADLLTGRRSAARLRVQ